MDDADKKRIAAFVEAAREGGWTRRQTRIAIYYYRLREHHDEILAALGFASWYDPRDTGPDGHMK